MSTVLIANSNLQESERLFSVLEKQFSPRTANSAQDFKPGSDRCDLVLLDANFTELQGIDFLMDVVANANVPVLFVCPLDDPKCAIEAAHSGAYNYIIRTESYLELIPQVIEDTLRSFNHRKHLDETILTLRARVAKLEKELKSLSGKGSAQSEAADPNKPSPGKAKPRKDLAGKIIQRLGSGEINLPSFPDTGKRLRKLLHDDASVAKIAELLREDPGITSKLIGVSNSPMYQTGSPNRTLEQAITCLGLNTTVQYVQIIENRSLYASVDIEFQGQIKSLWEHAIAVAHASSVLSALSSAGRPEEIFTLGLLHDIGKVLLLRILTEMKIAGESGTSMEKDALEDFLHQHHTGFGRAIVQRWGFPAEFSEVVLYHEDPTTCVAPSRELMVVHVANKLALVLGEGQNHQLEELLTGEPAQQLGLHNQSQTEIADAVRQLVNASSACD